jgi:hypothetical protein
MLAGDDRRYVVKMEVYAAHDPSALTDADLDADHMDEISQQIAALDDGPADFDDLPPAARSLRYDLCPECHTKFLRDPLSKESAQKFHFSEN